MLPLLMAARAGRPHDPNEICGLLDDMTRGVVARPGRRRHGVLPRNVGLSADSPGALVELPLRLAGDRPLALREEVRFVTTSSLGVSTVVGCKFSHNLRGRNSSPKGFAPRSKSPISKESGICFYYGRGFMHQGGQVPL